MRRLSKNNLFHFMFWIVYRDLYEQEIYVNMSNISLIYPEILVFKTYL